MVRVDFPTALLDPEYLDLLIREQTEDFITKARVAAAQGNDRYRHLFSTNAYGYPNEAKGGKVNELFGSLGLEERETLNGVAVAGSCQFSCLVDQLFGRGCSMDWRADVYLRDLALFVIATNEDQFRCFMLNANPKTRSQNKTAGESVDLEAYIRKMQKSSTDGDHLTLQAICDALQCPIHVLQVVDSPFADKIIAQSDLKNVVMNELHPRVLPHLHKVMPRLQVQRRELWLTLHGEAHFKSLHCTTFTEEEATAALAELHVLQSVMPDPPPTPTSQSSTSASLQPAPTPEAPAETCSICLEDVEVDRRRAAASGDRGKRDGSLAPAKPDVCIHIFHFGCLCSWAQISNVCPNCKARLQAIERLWGGKRMGVIPGRRGGPNRLMDGVTSVPPPLIESESEAEDDPEDPVRCYVCSRGNHPEALLLCDNYPHCPGSAHTWCLGLDRVPVGEWFCGACQGQRGVTRRRSTSDADESARARAERARRRSMSVEMADVAEPPPTAASASAGLVSTVASAGGRQGDRVMTRRRARTERGNPLAREIQTRHAEEITSTRPWAGVLSAAHSAAQRARAGGSNAQMPVRTVSSLQQQQAPPPFSPEVARAFADREAQLRAIQNGRPARTASTDRARSVYEVSSDEEEAGGRATGAADAGANAVARGHMRPTVHKRPRLAMGGAMGNWGEEAATQPHPPPALSAKDPRGVLARLEAAVDADVRSMTSGWPPTEMVRLTGELNSIFHWDQRDQAKLLNLGLLRVLRRFLDPMPGRPSFLPQHSKLVILRLLQALPIGMAHLRESGLNRVLLSVCTQPGEDRAVRDMVQSLICNWARFVFNVKANGASDGMSKPRWQKAPAYHPPPPDTTGGVGGGASSSGRGSGSAYGLPYVPVTDPSRLFAQGPSPLAISPFRT